MFGYVRPVLGRLDEVGRAAYRSSYCGLCHTMGKRYGFPARFSLNYDFTFLAVLLYSGTGETDKQCRRCPAHPIRTPSECLCGAGVDAAADISMILTWYKLTDDVEDRGFFAGLPYRVLRLIYRRGYRSAAARTPEYDARVCRGMEQLKQLEQQQSPQLDRVADTFASILSAAADGLLLDEAKARAMEQLLYHLGRWIYLIDAWDDLEEDEKQHRYNPLNARFNGQARQARDYVETTLTHSTRLLASAANLLDFGSWTAVVNNVIYSGLPTVQKAVLDGRWKELRRTREKSK